MSVLISVPIGMAISQYSNLKHACAMVVEPVHTYPWAHLGELFNGHTSLPLDT